MLETVLRYRNKRRYRHLFYNKTLIYSINLIEYYLIVLLLSCKNHLLMLARRISANIQKTMAAFPLIIEDAGYEVSPVTASYGFVHFINYRTSAKRCNLYAHDGSYTRTSNLQRIEYYNYSYL